MSFLLVVAGKRSRNLERADSLDFVFLAHTAASPFVFSDSDFCTRTSSHSDSGTVTKLGDRCTWAGGCLWI